MQTKSKVAGRPCPTLVLYGGSGTMAGCFDIPSEWAKRCTDVRPVAMPVGHFFVDQYPRETSSAPATFLKLQ